MTVKKLWCVLLAVLLLALAMSSCGEGSSGGLFDGLKKDTVYDLYDNLVRIDGFNNGLAAFMIYEKTSTSHWGIIWSVTKIYPLCRNLRR